MIIAIKYHIEFNAARRGSISFGDDLVLGAAAPILEGVLYHAGHNQGQPDHHHAADQQTRKQERQEYRCCHVRRQPAIDSDSRRPGRHRRGQLLYQEGLACRPAPATHGRRIKSRAGILSQVINQSNRRRISCKQSSRQITQVVVSAKNHNYPTVNHLTQNHASCSKKQQYGTPTNTI